jgi:hypothetical protein
MQSSCWSCVRTCATVLGNMRYFQVIRILWQVPWLIPAAAITSTIWERLARTNFLDLEFSSDHSTALRPKASSLYTCLVIWTNSLADLPNIWQNLTFARCSNCNILDFCRSQATASCWDERRMDTAPSRGPTYLL